MMDGGICPKYSLSQLLVILFLMLHNNLIYSMVNCFCEVCYIFTKVDKLSAKMLFGLLRFAGHLTLLCLVFVNKFQRPFFSSWGAGSRAILVDHNVMCKKYHA